MERKLKQSVLPPRSKRIQKISATPASHTPPTTEAPTTTGNDSMGMISRAATDRQRASKSENGSAFTAVAGRRQKSRMITVTPGLEMSTGGESIPPYLYKIKLATLHSALNQFSLYLTQSIARLKNGVKEIPDLGHSPQKKEQKIALTTPQKLLLLALGNQKCQALISRRITYLQQENTLNNSQFIIRRMVLANSLIKDMQQHFQNAHFMKHADDLEFSCETDLMKAYFRTFKSINELLPLFRQIGGQLWKFYSQDMRYQGFINLGDWLFFKICLSMYGLGVVYQNQFEFPLHQAVIQNNTIEIHKICACQSRNFFYHHVNQIDKMGNTALVLAVKLLRKDAVFLLCEHFANPKHKPFPRSKNVLSTGLTAIDHGIQVQSKEILALLVAAKHKVKQHNFQSIKEDLHDSLAKLRDFYIQIKFECNSKLLPFIKKWSPSDVFKIYKQGSGARVDMTLLQYKKLKCIRGKLSVLFKPREARKRNGELLFVNHQKQSVMKMLSDPQQSQVDIETQNLLKHIKKPKDFTIDKFDLHPEKKKWSGIKKLDNYIVEKWIADCQISSLSSFQNKVPIHQEIQDIHCYEEYIQIQQKSISQNLFLRLQTFPQKFKKEIKTPAFAMFLDISQQQDLCMNRVGIITQPLPSDLESSSQMSELNHLNPMERKSWNINKKHSLSNAERSSSSIGIRKELQPQFSASQLQNSPKPSHLIQLAQVSQSAKRLSEKKSKSKMSEKEFDKMQKQSLLKIKSKKTVHASFWLTRNGNFPLSYEDFLPLMQIVSFASKKISKIKDFLADKKLPDYSFPLKASIPLFMSVNAQISILNYKPLDTKEDLLSVDCKYISSPRQSFFYPASSQHQERGFKPKEWQPSGKLPPELLHPSEEDSDILEASIRF